MSVSPLKLFIWNLSLILLLNPSLQHRGYPSMIWTSVPIGSSKSCVIFLNSSKFKVSSQISAPPQTYSMEIHSGTFPTLWWLAAVKSFNPLTVIGALKRPEGVLCFKIQQKLYTASKFYTMGIRESENIYLEPPRQRL